MLGEAPPRHFQRAASAALFFAAQLRARPLDLKLELLLAACPFVLDVVGGPDRHRYSLPRNIDLEALPIFQSVRESSELRNELRNGVALLDISIRVSLLRSSVDLLVVINAAAN